MERRVSFSKMGMIVLAVLMQFALAGIFAAPAHASDVDVLIDKLVEKGVLTRTDAEAILKETKEAEKVQPAEKTTTAEELPAWLKKISIGGDLRLRYEYRYLQAGTKPGPYNLGRFRYRLHVDGQVLDNLKIVFGLASSSGDPRSQNVTYGNGTTKNGSFAGEPVVIDQAYVQYNPVKALTLVGGKFPNPIWTPSQIIWDTDIKPEGAAATLTVPAADGLAFFLNTDFFVLQPNSNPSPNTTPFLFAVQPGIKLDFAPGVHVKLAGTYYNFTDLKGSKPGYTSNTNTPIGGGFSVSTTGLKYDYNMLSAGAEIGFDNIVSFLPYTAVYGEYVNNPDPSTGDNSYLVGIKFGDKKVKEFGQWIVSYDYRREGRDAVPDILPESDFFNGYTDVYGNKTTFTFGLGKNVYTAVNWYDGHSANPAVTNGGTKKWEVVQVDLGMSF
jgi:polyhydroxyalkanoate synthesis regulator phasin